MRTTVCALSALVAVTGWASAILIWLSYGDAAGVRPDFFLGLSMAIAGTLAWTMSAIMPDQAALYALGYRDGVKCADCPLERTEPAPPRRHLSSV